MGRNFSMPFDVDEADLDAELDALGTELDFEEEVPSYLQDSAAVPLSDPLMDASLGLPPAADSSLPQAAPPAQQQAVALSAAPPSYSAAGGGGGRM